MKRYYFTISVLLLTALLLIGCGKSPVEETAVVDPTATPATEQVTVPTAEATVESTVEPTIAPTAEPTAEPTATPTIAPTAVPTATPTIEPTVVPVATLSPTYAVYASQIDRYYTAISQQWNEWTYMENGMSAMPAYYYDGSPLDNIGYTVMDLNGDGISELIIGAILNAESSPLVFEIWTMQNNAPVMLAQSGSRNRYYLQYAVDDDLWTVAYEGENGAANHAVHYLLLDNGEFKVIQGVIFDAVINEQAPWFMTYDLDWDISNDTPIDEQTATDVMNAQRNIYTTVEYCPYSTYK